MVGIIGLMDEEVISVKRRMHVTGQREIAGMEFFLGTVDEKEVVAVRSGNGKVSAAVCTQILIDHFSVEYIINVGVASGLNPELSIGDILVASDLSENNAKSLMNQRLMEVAYNAVEHLRGERKIFEGRITSEDEFICSTRVKEEIYTMFTAYCAEMEGTAIAHTCFLNKVPFVVIRTISDVANPDVEMNFEDFVDESARNVSRVVEGILKAI